MNKILNTVREQMSVCALTLIACLAPMKAHAQLSSNPDKFLGNITTDRKSTRLNSSHQV